MIKYDLDMLKQALQDSPEVAAAYLFGSASPQGFVQNPEELEKYFFEQAK